MPAFRCSRLFGGLAASVLLFGCAEEKSLFETISAGPTGAPTGNPSGNPSGSPTGDPTEGGTEGGTESGTTGGGQGDCGQYLMCIEVISPETLPEAEAAYGASGTCWETPAATQMCLDACTTGLAAYGLLFPDEPACGGGSGTTGEPTTTGAPTTTTDPSTSTTTSTTSTTSTTEPDTDTGGEGYGNCGWAAANMYYACGGVGADPGGVNPIACPANLPLAGEPCTTINEIGCCTPTGDNYYCNGVIVAIEACGA